MADITIDSNVENNTNFNAQPRNLVWVSSSTGYIFFIDDNDQLHYRKTTNSGASWGTEATIRSGGTIHSFAIWYDKWTKGDSGDVIHIIFVDSTIGDDLTYNSFSTSDDTLDGEVTAILFNSAITGDWTDNCISIVKSKNGIIFVGGWVDSGGENAFAKATMTSGLATSFTGKTSMADGDQVDRIQFLPGNETDTDDIWCLYQDVSANRITLKVFDDSGNTWSESAAIDTMVETTTLFGFDSMERHSDSHTILVLWNENQSATGDIATWDLTDSSNFEAKANVVNNNSAFGIVGLLIDQNRDDLYVCYSNGTTTGSIKYKKSTDGGGNWGSEKNMSVTSDDHKTVYGGTSIGNGDSGRWGPIWFNDDLNDLITNKDNSVEISPLLFDSAILGCNF